MNVRSNAYAGFIIFTVLVACTACTPFEQWFNAPELESPRTTIIAYPQGLPTNQDKSKQKDELVKFLFSQEFKSLFSYCVDEFGKKLQVKDLGLEVGKYTGTLQPVPHKKFEFIMSKGTNEKGELSLLPFFSASAKGASREYVLLSLKGNVLEITPEYTLTINPVRPILPRCYIQDLYYADEIVIDSVAGSGIELAGEGRYKLLKASAEFERDLSTAFLRDYKHAIFGRFQVVADTGAKTVMSSTATVDLSVGAKVTFPSGEAFVAEIKSIQKDDAIVLAFLGIEKKIKKQAWAHYDKWTVIHYADLDASSSPRRVRLTLITVSKEFIESHGARLRFMDHDDEIAFEPVRINDENYRRSVRGLSAEQRGKILIEAARFLKKAHQQITKNSAKQFTETDFLPITELTDFISQIDSDDNGHLLYYEGDKKRWLNKEDRSGSGYLRSHEDFDRYLTALKQIPQSDQDKGCYEEPRGFCRERTAFILHLLSYDFYRKACESGDGGLRKSYLEKAKEKVSRSLEFYRDGFCDPTQLICTKVFQGWLSEQLNGSADHCAHVIQVGEEKHSMLQEDTLAPLSMF